MRLGDGQQKNRLASPSEKPFILGPGSGIGAAGARRRHRRRHGRRRARRGQPGGGRDGCRGAEGRPAAARSGRAEGGCGPPARRLGEGAGRRKGRRGRPGGRSAGAGAGRQPPRSGRRRGRPEPRAPAAGGGRPAGARRPPPPRPLKPRAAPPPRWTHRRPAPRRDERCRRAASGRAARPPTRLRARGRGLSGLGSDVLLPGRQAPRAGGAQAGPVCRGRWVDPQGCGDAGTFAPLGSKTRGHWGLSGSPEARSSGALRVWHGHGDPRRTVEGGSNEGQVYSRIGLLPSLSPTFPGIPFLNQVSHAWRFLGIC